MSNYSVTIRKRAGVLRPFAGQYEIVIRSADLGGTQVDVYATEMDLSAAEALMQAAADGAISLKYPEDEPSNI